MTATHPTDHELQSFLLGKLADPHHGQVESHLADCPECGRRALAAPADDTLTELLAAARTRLDSERASAPTPTLDGSATPPAFAPTLAWSSSAAPHSDTAPPALATHPKYRVVRRLGTGGMGTVWLAEHQVMHRPVAVKVIRPDLLARPGATGRFLREVRAAARLHHPNIVTAFDAEPAGDSCLLVMEYVPGQTLGERLEAGPLAAAEACRAVRDAARGLAHAHAAGLVHRDVKPHNLIRAADGTTKVLDFGLAGVGAGEVPAASGDGLTGAGMVVGTPDYIAPEQIADPHAADARADIYGLGCTLYHLLAGRPPLPAGSVAEKLAAQPTHEPDPIPGLASDLVAVLAKMMAKRPEDRYQTADELIAALEPFSGVPVSRDAPAERGRPPFRWLALAAGLLAIATTAGLIVKIQRDNQEITVQTDDPDIEVVMKRKGEVLRVIDKKSGQTWEVNVLTNEIGLADTPGGLKLTLPENETVYLRRHGKEVFRITRVRQPAADTAEAKLEAAVRAAEAHLKLMDAGDLARAWEEADAETHKSIPRDQFIDALQELARKNGKLLARTLAGREFEPMAGGARSATSVRLTYHSTFERSGERTETLGVVLEADGRWRVQTHRFDPPRPPAALPGSPPAPRLVQTIHERRFPYAIAYTPDGKALLAAGRDYFAVYDPATGKDVFTDNLGSAGFGKVAVSGDGRTAAVESHGDIHLYDLVAQKRVGTIPRRADAKDTVVPVTALTLTRDGQTLAAISGREAVYYDRATGQTEYTRPDDKDVGLAALYYSPDGRYLVVASHIEPGRKIRISVLDAKTRELVARRELTGLFGSAHFSADGKRLFLGGTRADGRERTFVVLGMPGGEVFERELDLPPGLGAPVPSPDGLLLAVTGKDGDVRIWDRGPRRVTFSWTPHPDAQPEFPPPPRGKAPPLRTSVAFAPDGRTLATARGDQIKVWDLTADRPIAAPAKADQDRILADVERRIDPATTDGKGLPFALLERNGVAAVRFGKWLLVFEGVPCDSGGKVLFGVGSFFFPEAGGRGGNFVDPGLKRPAPALRQQFDGRGNVIGIERYEFQMEAKGARLVFADKTYEATDKVQTVVVARDGTTRLDPPAAKK